MAYVLGIERYDDLRELLHAVFISAGHETMLMRDVTSAHRVLSMRKPDVIVIDFTRPLDQEQLWLARTALLAEIPVVGCTEDQDLTEEIRHYPPLERVLLTPWQIDEIAATVEAAVHR